MNGTTTWIEALSGPRDQKRRYKLAKARIDALPKPYSEVAGAVERYLLRAGVVVDGDSIVRLVGDLADLWERAAGDGTPVREIVGDDPVAYAESFANAYSARSSRDTERARLVRAVAGTTGMDKE